MENNSKGKGRTTRPDAILFDAVAARQRFGPASVQLRAGNQFSFNRQSFRDGLLMLSLRLSDVNMEAEPSPEELRAFAGAQSWLGSARARVLDIPWTSTALSATQVAGLVNRNRELRPGQAVIVVDEQLQGLRGSVITVEGDMVVIQGQHENLSNSNELIVPLASVRRYFTAGTHVKAVRGVHCGQWGMVIHVDESHSRLKFMDAATQREVSHEIIGVS